MHIIQRVMLHSLTPANQICRWRGRLNAKFASDNRKLKMSDGKAGAPSLPLKQTLFGR